MKKLIFFLPLLFIAIAAIWLGFHAMASGPGGISVVAGENFWGNIAAQIGGSNVHTISIITNPNQDPHEYESTAADARAITNANIVIENGLGYDTFMQKIIATSGSKRVINVGQLAGLTDQDNPHLWYNLDIVQKVALALESDFVHTDSRHAAAYNANYTTFVRSLTPIMTECREIQQQYQGTQVIATERVFDYMLESCGIIAIPNDFQKAVEEGTDPSVQAVNAFTFALTSHQARVLIYNKQTVSQITGQMQTIAQQHHIPVVGVTETMPSGSGYQGWILSELQALASALHTS